MLDDQRGDGQRHRQPDGPHDALIAAGGVGVEQPRPSDRHARNHGPRSREGGDHPPTDRAEDKCRQTEGHCDCISELAAEHIAEVQDHEVRIATRVTRRHFVAPAISGQAPRIASVITDGHPSAKHVIAVARVQRDVVLVTRHAVVGQFRLETAMYTQVRTAAQSDQITGFLEIQQDILADLVKGFEVG